MQILATGHRELGCIRRASRREAEFRRLESKPHPSAVEVGINQPDTISTPPTMVAQLPIELLQLIFQDATPEALRRYRLVDRQWCAASTPRVFERIHASLFSRSLTKLSALSQSPLAKHVKAIDYHPDQLPNINRQNWEARIDLRESISTYRAGLGEDVDWSQLSSMYNKLTRHEYTPEQLETGWSAYEAYYSEQKSWIDGQVGLALKDCISRLHNLREVVVEKAKPFRGGRLNDVSYWRNFMREILIGPDAWTYVHTQISKLEAFSTLYMITAVGERTAVPGVKAVENLTIDLPEGNSFYDMIHMPSDDRIVSDDSFFRSSAGADPENTNPSELYELVVNAFRSLKDLILRGPSVVDEADIDLPGCRSQIMEAERFLTAAVNLRSLDLYFGEPNRSYEGANREADQFDQSLLLLLSRDDTTYPHLEDLRISAAFPSNYFSMFLTLHKDTLKRLDIRDCLSDNWDHVLKVIGRVLKQDHIYIESLWSLDPEDDSEDDDPALFFGEGLDAGDEYSENVKAFLQTGEGELPQRDLYEEVSEESDDEHGDGNWDLWT